MVLGALSTCDRGGVAEINRFPQQLHWDVLLVTVCY